MFDRHQAEITHAVHRSLSSGASVYDSTAGFYLVPYCRPSLPTRFLPITAIGMCHFLLVHHLGMACWPGRRPIYNTQTKCGKSNCFLHLFMWHWISWIFQNIAIFGMIIPLVIPRETNYIIFPSVYEEKQSEIIKVCKMRELNILEFFAHCPAYKGHLKSSCMDQYMFMAYESMSFVPVTSAIDVELLNSISPYNQFHIWYHHIKFTGLNDKIVVLKKTIRLLYFKSFIEKINSGNLIM